MNKEYKCPECDKAMRRKSIMYGLPDPAANHDNVILGGCCIADDVPWFGYECPACEKVFVVKQGQLLPFSDDEESDEGSEIDDKDKDETEKIDDDIETLEMLDFFEDER